MRVSFTSLAIFQVCRPIRIAKVGMLFYDRSTRQQGSLAEQRVGEEAEPALAQREFDGCMLSWFV